MATRKTIKPTALRLAQSDAVPVYLFSLRARDLLALADVSRLARDASGDLVGYQRPRVRRHVRDIARYVHETDAVFPNSIILALASSVTFLPLSQQRKRDAATLGRLVIPYPRADAPRPGWIVDGQQRTLALAQAERPDLPIPVSAFITDDIALQRDQFLRVNNTKPLPRGLIHELLPTIETPLPEKLERRRLPSHLCDRLNENPDSPFFGLIRRPSLPKAQRKAAVVTDTSLLRAIEDSLRRPAGALFGYQNVATGTADVEAIERLLLTYWTAVRDTFPEAWGLPARQSRLMHGVGIRAMGQLMDDVMGGLAPYDADALAALTDELRPLRAVCRWRTGTWDGLGGLPWNGLQNTKQHVRLLSTYLRDCYQASLTAIASPPAA